MTWFEREMVVGNSPIEVCGQGAHNEEITRSRFFGHRAGRRRNSAALARELVERGETCLYLRRASSARGQKGFDRTLQCSIKLEEQGALRC